MLLPRGGVVCWPASLAGVGEGILCIIVEDIFDKEFPVVCDVAEQ